MVILTIEMLPRKDSVGEFEVSIDREQMSWRDAIQQWLQTIRTLTLISCGSESTNLFDPCHF